MKIFWLSEALFRCGSSNMSFRDLQHAQIITQQPCTGRVIPSNKMNEYTDYYRLTIIITDYYRNYTWLRATQNMTTLIINHMQCVFFFFFFSNAITYSAETRFMQEHTGWLCDPGSHTSICVGMSAWPLCLLVCHQIQQLPCHTPIRHGSSVLCP